MLFATEMRREWYLGIPKTLKCYVTNTRYTIVLWHGIYNGTDRPHYFLKIPEMGNN